MKRKTMREGEPVAGFSLSNLILVQQEDCDWSGKREAELRVRGTESNSRAGGGWGGQDGGRTGGRS